mgnify:CR=1 FL=1
MKKTIVLLGCLFITQSYFSQVDTSRVSVISEKRDTLFLAKTELGYSIYSLWQYSSTEKPIIIFRTKQWIVREYDRRSKLN